jgi:hypothetical protein
MFGMSVNDVPGWLVAIAPSAIGVPVAGTPGFAPHCEVLTVAAPGALELAPALALELVPVLAGVLLVVLELLQPAAASARAAANRNVLRARGAGICGFICPPPVNKGSVWFSGSAEQREWWGNWQLPHANAEIPTGDPAGQ